MKVFSYLRVSGLGQVDGDGPDRQRQATASFCASHDITIEAEFFEPGVSGTIDGLDRPVFADVLSKIDRLNSVGEPLLKIDGIVVESMDRLARDLMVSEFLLKECRTRGIKVFCADRGELVDVASDGGDPTRTLLRQVMGAIAEWEKSVTVKKLRAARLRARSTGNRCEGVRPYGFSDAEKIVIGIMKKFKEKGFSFPEIAIELNADGFRTRYNKQWSADSVQTAFTGRKQKAK